MTRVTGLFWRALLAFLALPGVVAFLVPWHLRPRGAHFSVAALPIVGIGTVLLLWCVRDFYVAGRRTLAPWAPPERLVTLGLYRVSRNPMYVAVLTLLLGFALGYRSITLGIYAAAVALAFHVRVVRYEEPTLARLSGSGWRAYRARVPRWIGAAPVATARDDRELTG
ncbi:MAG TPA: isoprenylcysteine carboxylmethyltransferase family protein [Gemmatimonadaceae bacterium]|nr:isoprenylcysteine carboxylmethyltransferase family protein [Gemmatimonadaceae bacterium]